MSSKQKVKLEFDEKMDNKTFKCIKTNRKFWWIKDQFTDEFINIEKIDGNKKFLMELDLELESTYYTVGCGSKKNGVRINFYVNKDGNICFE